MDSPTNPNYWKCDCASHNLHNNYFESACLFCGKSILDSPHPTQEEVTAESDRMFDEATKLSKVRHELPQPRKKPAPTREEFEASLKWLAENPEHWSNRLTVAGHQMIVKRYKALS